MRRLYRAGVEKVSLNRAALECPDLVRTAATEFGSQSVVVSIDVRRSPLGLYRVAGRRGRQLTGVEPSRFAADMERLGAGEILLNSVELDGSMRGLDIELVRRVSASVSAPVIACGGTADLADAVKAVRDGGAWAVACGSLFAFQGTNRAVLINYPSRSTLEEAFKYLSS
jgi:cyclase